MTKNDFISSIGYDGAAAVVDKERRAKNGGKTLQALLEAGAFRSAAAFAAYDDSQEELHTTANILRVFGITKTNSKKVILL